MAKKTAAKPVPPTSLDIPYNLRDLPSAQHKAGLAGLLLSIENMDERKQAGLLKPEIEIPEVVAKTATTATIRFTERSAQDLFDDLYAAKIVEVRSKSKWQGATEKRQDPNPNPGPNEPKKWFVYDVVQPSGFFLKNYTEGDKEHWHKLWRDMLYAVPRNKPTTRQPFKSRAAKEPTKEGADCWKGFLTAEKARTRGGVATTELAGSLMLAVQAATAETVPFEDRVESQLLLHFWPLAARVFVPQQIDSDGKSEFVGYTLAIPEVADLGRYCRNYKTLLTHLDPARIGYRPRDAVITIPEQGSLEFLENLDRLASERVVEERSARYIAGVEFFHMVVAGQNVKLRAHGRIAAEGRLLAEYEALRRHFHNPEFVAGRLRALLRDRPWFSEFDAPLHQREWSFFVHLAQERRRTPPAMIGFAWEVNQQFQSILDRALQPQQPEDRAMPQAPAPPDAVDAIIYSLVGAYVKQRACIRSRVDPNDKEWWSKTNDERRDVCGKLFLELRSRHGDDFVTYFTDTIASVPQWLNDSRYLEVARALMRHYTDEEGENRPRTRDDVKTLTMLALSAHSRSLKSRESAADGPSSDTTPTENAE